MATETEYATRSEVKNYLGIPQDMNKFDDKLQLILDSVNENIIEDTGKAPNKMLKLGALAWVEKFWNKSAGVKREGDRDLSLTFEESQIPSEVKQLVGPHVKPEKRPKYGYASIDAG